MSRLPAGATCSHLKYTFCERDIRLNYQLGYHHSLRTRVVRLSSIHYCASMVGRWFYQVLGTLHINCQLFTCVFKPNRCQNLSWLFGHKPWSNTAVYLSYLSQCCIREPSLVCKKVSKFILSKMYKSILKNNTIQTFKNRLKVCTYSVTTWRLH